MEDAVLIRGRVAPGGAPGPTQASVGAGEGAEVGFMHALQVAMSTLPYQFLPSYSEDVQLGSQGSYGSGVQSVSTGTSG